jgi:hypothetical protein
MADQHYVYLYRDSGSARIKYIGYGKEPARAMSHAGASHNTDLRKWLEGASYTLSIAGPYRDETEGLAVEAALISAMQPEFNSSPGTGPKFRPVGVPPELSDRVLQPPLSESEVGKRAGGALLVYIKAGQVTGDGRTKPDPTTPEVEPIASNAEGWWQIGHHLQGWADHPDTSPQALIAVYGENPRYRFILGSFEIDPDRWSAVKPNSEGLWPVPLKDRTDADAHGLRGRRVDVKFARGRWAYYRWIDREGVLRPHSSA